MKTIRSYARSGEYIFLILISLAFATYYTRRGLGTGDLFLALASSRLYLYGGLLTSFILFALKNLSLGPKLLKSWLGRVFEILCLGLFAIISLSLVLVLVGELAGIFSLGQPSPSLGSDLAGLKAYRSIGPVIAYTGLSFLTCLAMSLWASKNKALRGIFLIMTIFFLINIVSPYLVDLPFILDPAMQMSSSYALDYGISGPYLLSIFQVLGLALMANLMVVVEKKMGSVK